MLQQSVVLWMRMPFVCCCASLICHALLLAWEPCRKVHVKRNSTGQLGIGNAGDAEGKAELEGKAVEGKAVELEEAEEDGEEDDFNHTEFIRSTDSPFNAFVILMLHVYVSFRSSQ